MKSILFGQEKVFNNNFKDFKEKMHSGTWLQQPAHCDTSRSGKEKC